MIGTIREGNKNKRKFLILMPSLIIAFFVIFVISLNIGLTQITVERIFQTLIGNGTKTESVVMFMVRLPSVAVAVVVGICLTVSGAVMQGITRNPLATPSMLGVTSGAGFAVLLSVFAYENDLIPVLATPIASVVGGLVTFTIVYRLAVKHDLSPTKLILNGIAVNSCIGALSLIVTMRLSPTSFTFLNTTLGGSLTYATWDKIWLATLIMVPLVLFIVYKAIYLNVLNLGEDVAIGLGVNLKKERRNLMYVTVVLTSIAAYIAGGITFVGLVAPHIARRLVGPNFKLLIPISVMVGIMLIVVSDIISRAFFANAVPIGMILSVLGAPYLLYLLFTADR